MKKHQQNKWYYCAEFGQFYGFRVIEEPNPDAWHGNIWGPFNTFSEAKRDAIKYFQTDIETSRMVLREVKSEKKNKG